ncbi:energy transducer TonB [Sphingomonas fuzhouensis]|uniref:energy transducer TonB n=1 Tax=Sphingomonas fuzhouensis TaxID=3106033 RepID=UPI002AFEB355|nr:energy transducer TonB [Sphingomonas sp. SGZ-02]
MAAQTVATPPVPDGAVTDWVHPDDYPPASMRAGDEGRVSVQLHVDASGMVTGCQVTNSSGHPLLDAQTCRVLTLRAHFKPARDASGQAIAATTPVMSFRWQIPEGRGASVGGAAPAPLSPGDQNIVNEGMTFLKSLGSPQLPATLPVTPDRLALANRLMDVASKQSDPQELEDAALSLAEERFVKTVAGLPPRGQLLAKADLHAAYDVAWRHNRQRNLDRLERYYAARLTDDEMRKIIEFFSSGIGYQSVHHGEEWTQANRQALGMAMFEHPELAKWAKVNLDMMQGLAAQMHDQERAFQADLSAALCPRLARDHIQLSTCPAIKSTPVASNARPAKLLTTHF